jgi:hypothetical protein
MRALVLCALVAGIVSVGFFACNPNSIGRPCVNPANSAPLGTQVSSPALECPSRLCLLQPPNASSGVSGNIDGGARATCTATCDNNDDCDPETKAFCSSGFVCAVAVQAGAFCCRKMCICKDDLVEGVNKTTNAMGQISVITPASCDPKQNSTGRSVANCRNVQ